MKKIIFICFCLIIATGITFAQNWQWKNATPDSKILKDNSNNLYVFSNGTSAFTIEKFDGNGSVLWTKTASGNAAITACKTDPNNNLIVLGNITSSTTISAFTLFPKGQKSFFILKFSPSGTVLSANVYGSSGQTFANDLFINAGGEFLIGGGFTGTFDINGHSITGDTLQNLFIVKTDGNQNVLWSEKSTFNTSLGEASVDEIVETSSGKIYATITCMYGLIEYKGFQFTSYGQYLVQLDTTRNIVWTNYLDYPPYSYTFFSDMQTKGDTLYMKVFIGGNHGSSGAIYMWNDAGIKVASYYSVSSSFGYSVANNKIYYAFIGVNNPWNATFSYRKTGCLTPGLSELKLTTDSAVTVYGSYSELQYINDSTLYIAGYGEGMNTHFAGKFSRTNRVAANFKLTTPPCENNDVVFENTSMRDTAAYWEFSGGVPATSAKISDTVRFNTTGIHTVKLISSNGISSDTVVQNIFINPQPAQPVVSQNTNTLFSSYNYGNQWYFENDSIPLATQNNYAITYEGNYKTRFTDANGCYNFSNNIYASFSGISDEVTPLTHCWVKRIKGARYERPADMISTLDGGFLISSFADDFPAVSVFKSHLVKTDASGNLQWAKAIGPNVWPAQLKQKGDSGYVFLANKGSGLCLVWLNKNGETDSVKAFKYNSWSIYAHSFDITADGGFIISAFFHSESSPFFNGYLLKLSAQGNVEWTKVLKGLGFTDTGPIFQTPDGGYIFSGYGSFPCCTSQNYLCKLNSAGDIQWIKEFQGLGYILDPSTMTFANDGGYVMAGSTMLDTAAGQNAYVLKVNSAGDFQWCKSYGTVYSDKAFAIKSTGTGYIVAGRTNGFRTQDDLYLFKIDNDGNEIWSRAYGSLVSDNASSLLVTKNGFVLSGVYGNGDWNQADIYFLKTDTLGHSGCREIIVWTQTKDIFPTLQTTVPQIDSGVYPDTATVYSESVTINDSLFCLETISNALKPEEESNSINIFPNPGNGKFTVESFESVKTISVFNTMGEIILAKKAMAFRTELDLSQSTAGIYFVEINCGNKKITRKIIIE